jgi:hypothetical protein
MIPKSGSGYPDGRPGLPADAIYGTTGGTIYVMEKTTVYLPEDLKDAVRRSARRRGVSEATVIRDSIRAAVGSGRPRPRAGLFASGDPMADRVDELLAGFGER